MVPDPKAMRKAIMIAKAVASKVDPRFGNIQMPGVDQAIGNTDGGIVEDHGKTVPESPRTLELQRQMLMQGKRKAMLYTPGTPIPPPIQGIMGVRTPQGVIHYNPSLISHEEVVHASQNNRLNEVLGLGPYSKDDVAEKVMGGEPLLAVVSRDQNGHEAVSAAGTPSTANEQIASLHEHAPEGGSVGIEPFEQVVGERGKGPVERAFGGDVEPRDLSEQGLYSHAAEAAEALPQAKGTGQQMLASLKGVKPEELKWSGAQDAFADRPSVTRDELAQHFRDNAPKIQETVLKDEPPSAENDWSTTRGAKFSKHTIPGGENYREVLMHLPKNENEDDNFYHQDHWGDKANVLAHLRLSDRPLPNGGTALHMEELQSDWGQQGRGKGFSTAFTPEEKLQYDLLQNERSHFHEQMRRTSDDDDEAFDRAHRARQEVSDKMRDLSKKTEGLPSAPYVGNTNNWTDLGLKRALTEAVRGGYDKLIWTPGQEQADRYDLSKHIGQIHVEHPTNPHHAGKISLTSYGVGDDDWEEGAIDHQVVHPDQLDDVVGKEVADRIRSRVVMPSTKSGYAVINPISRNTGPIFDTEEEAEADRNQYPEPHKLKVIPHEQNIRGQSIILRDVDLKTGGEGMKGYYDNIVPKRLLALARDHDPEAAIGSTTISGGKTRINGMPSMYPEQHKVPSIDITPKMRESILSKGFKSFARGGDVEADHMAVGGDVENYQDPTSRHIEDWNWRPLSDVQESLGNLKEIPSHVINFGNFMDQTAEKASKGGLSPRDLIKAYTITRASIQRGAVNSDKVRAAGLQLPDSVVGKIRPEGAFGEWLHSPAGQSYLDAAEKGQIHKSAISNAVKVMMPFGKAQTDIPDALNWAAANLPGHEGNISNLIAAGREQASSPNEWRAIARKMRGIGPSKSGFVASLMGRGDQPTLDARQVILQSGGPNKTAQRYIRRKGGEGGVDSVDRLAARQTAMDLSLPSNLEPYRQHLTHHAIWDKAGNEETTHEDVMNAVRHAADGGQVSPSGLLQGHDVVRAMKAYGLPGLDRIRSPMSENPEHVKEALKIAAGLKIPTGVDTGTGSFYNIKQPFGVQMVKSMINNIPNATPLKVNPMSWEDVVRQGSGGTLINLGGDRSNLGRLTHIDDKELAWPIDLHAGPKYMLEPNRGAVWANSPSHASSLKNVIGKYAKNGPVFGAYTPMGTQSLDSSHNMFDALMAQIPGSNIDKSTAKAFDQAIMSGSHVKGTSPKDVAKRQNSVKLLQGWPGIQNAKEASEFAKTLPGSHRSDIVKFMDSRAWLERGLPAVGMTRVAITDPEVRDIPGNMIGHRIVQLDPESGGKKELSFEHSTYKSPTSGSYVGDVPPVQRQYAMPDVIESMVQKPTKSGQIVHPYSADALGRSTARKLFEEQKQAQPINQKMLDSIMGGLESQKQYGFKNGGSISKATGIAMKASKKKKTRPS